mgnify:CR=1 FL=1
MAGGRPGDVAGQDGGRPTAGKVVQTASHRALQGSLYLSPRRGSKLLLGYHLRSLLQHQLQEALAETQIEASFIDHNNQAFQTTARLSISEKASNTGLSEANRK